MTSIVLDTNVVSELLKPAPDPRVTSWMRRVNHRLLTSVTIMELMYGMWRMPEGRRRSNLARAITALLRQYEKRILSLDTDAAIRCSLIRADLDAHGHPVDLADTQIAAIAHVHGCAVATRNVKDFEHTGVALVNPWQE